MKRSGSFEDALANGHQLLKSHPEAALKQAETLVRLERDPRVFRLAAEACRILGLKADAQGAELGAIEASLSAQIFKDVALALAEGRAGEALETAEALLVDEPNDLLARTFVAEAFIELWEIERAEALLRSVLERAPAFLRASMLLATCLTNQVRMREAISIIGEVVSRKPNNVLVLNQLGQLLHAVGDNLEATGIFERLVALDEGQAERWSRLAHHYRILGRSQDSIAAFRKALAIDPLSGSAWWGLANYYPEKISDEDERSICEALSNRTGQIDEPALHIALGLVADRAGRRPQAFDHIADGKKARLAQQPYDPGSISKAVISVIEKLTPEFYEHRSSAGWDDGTPIFVIGMHRSGTTLVERILGRHSDIEGAGEMKILPKLAELIRHKADDPQDYAELLEMLDDDRLAWVGREYVRASREYRRTQKRRFIDKNNLNWMQVGLILLALPNAKVIDVRRGALDCCWANFKMLFAEGFPATNDLRHVGQFYRDYVRLFDAMKVAAPDRILSVRYEDVVDDIEGQTRRMLEFVGLDYEAECIDFHLSTDAVATASSEQVRKPLNRKGIGSAEPYRQWLGPLIEELGPLAD